MELGEGATLTPPRNLPHSPSLTGTSWQIGGHGSAGPCPHLQDPPARSILVRECCQVPCTGTARTALPAGQRLRRTPQPPESLSTARSADSHWRWAGGVAEEELLAAFAPDPGGWVGRDPSRASHASVPPLTGVVLTCFMPQGWSLVSGGLLLALQVRGTGWDRFLCVLVLLPVCSSVAGGGGGEGGGGPTAPVGRPAPSREFCASLVASSRESVQTQSGSSTGRGGPLPLTSGAVPAVLGPHPPAALGVLLAPSWHWLYQAALSCLWSSPQVTALLCGVSRESSSRQSLATRSPYGGCLRRACLGPPCTPVSCLLASLFAPQDTSCTLSWGDLMLARWPRCGVDRGGQGPRWQG